MLSAFFFFFLEIRAQLNLFHYSLFCRNPISDQKEERNNDQTSFTKIGRSLIIGVPVLSINLLQIQKQKRTFLYSLHSYARSIITHQLRPRKIEQFAFYPSRRLDFSYI